MINLRGPATIFYEYHFKKLKKLRINVSLQIMVTKDYVTTLKQFAVFCCFESEGTNGLKLENISLMFSISENVSWKNSS